MKVIDENIATIDKATGASVTVTGVAAGQTILKATNGKKEVLAIIIVTE